MAYENRIATAGRSKDNRTSVLMMANHWSCVTLWIAPIDGGATGGRDEYGVEIWHETSSI